MNKKYVSPRRAEGLRSDSALSISLSLLLTIRPIGRAYTYNEIMPKHKGGEKYFRTDEIFLLLFAIGWFRYHEKFTF